MGGTKATPSGHLFSVRGLVPGTPKAEGRERGQEATRQMEGFTAVPRLHRLSFCSPRSHPRAPERAPGGVQSPGRLHPALSILRPEAEAPTPANISGDFHCVKAFCEWACRPSRADAVPISQRRKESTERVNSMPQFHGTSQMRHSHRRPGGPGQGVEHLPASVSLSAKCHLGRPASCPGLGSLLQPELLQPAGLSGDSSIRKRLKRHLP